MQINLTRKQELKTNTWLGGTTTQLAIYPKEAVYKKLDFVFRISTATIDVEQSTFTSLPNVSRIIMVLNGELTIQHKNQYSKQLKKFDADSFSGNWETSGVGKATDFNIMTTGRTKASLEGFLVQEKTSKEFIADGDMLAVYVSAGEINIESTLLLQGDIALMSPEQKNEKIILQAIHKADIVIAQIYF
jgi:environmental stress-induced protein Ves